MNPERNPVELREFNLRAHAASNPAAAGIGEPGQADVNLRFESECFEVSLYLPFFQPQKLELGALQRMTPP